jgi:integrase
MTDSYVRVLLKRLAERAGIDKRVHAHGLRHTHAAQLRAEGVDIGIISKQLGHASISTTARYLDHLAPRAVIEAMRSRIVDGASTASCQVFLSRDLKVASLSYAKFNCTGR